MLSVGTSAPPVSTRENTHPPRRSYAVERLFLQRMYQRIGRPNLQIVLWDNSVVGVDSSPVGQVIIHDPRVLRQIVMSPLVAFGEAYSSKQLTVKGNLIEVVAEINRGLSRATPASYWSRQQKQQRSRNTYAKSKACVYHHYDIGNEFYKLWLDPQLVYTCAYYPTPDTTLDDAQTAKLDHVCRKLRLKPGESVIEAGCGWGGLALHMVRKYGVSVRAFNLSREQLAYARQLAQQQGLSDRVEFIEDDYRNITGKCDAFVSVGMLEHVGTDNYREMGEMMNRVLTPEGRGLIHSIGRNVARPLDAWTLKYIFPGACPPSLRQMMDLFESSGFSVLDVENLRLHYAHTCADWLERFDAHEDDVRQMFDERFVLMWRLYLASASATFVSGDLQLFQVVFAREQNNQIPMTRDDWYCK